MATLAKFHAQPHHHTFLRKPISRCLRCPSKPHLSFPTPLNFNANLRKSQTGFNCSASRTKKNGGLGLSETDDPYETEDDFDGDGGESEFEGDEDEIAAPLLNMRKWLENRPRGFGEGKVYDTSVEDDLMEEIEQSRKAQLANVSKLKSGAVKSEKGINKHDQGSTDIQDGFRVRLLNLPKKKNIHKDLRLAFEGVRGILNIVPVVSGNEKTRDPVCKGLAFIDFKQQVDAQRFVQNFSGKSISFGKVQKQIKCEMMNPKKSNPTFDQSVDESKSSREQPVLNYEIDVDADVLTDFSLLKSREESVRSESDTADETYVTAQWEDDDKIEKTSTTSDLAGKEEFESNSLTSKQKSKLKTNEKNVASKRKKKKIPKLKIPGSSNRLKIREKEMLTDVFSKYGALVKEQSR